jgi:hypothetical protein
MKRLLTVISALIVLSVAAAVPAASADSGYRVRFFGCATGNYDASLVPHDTPLFVKIAYFSGTPGLVESFIQDIGDSAALTDVRIGGTTVYHSPWEPIAPDSSVVLNGWVTSQIYNLPPLALGQQATLTFSDTLAHPETDLGVPVPSDGVFTLQYHDTVPAGTSALTCTITGV